MFEPALPGLPTIQQAAQASLDAGIKRIRVLSYRDLGDEAAGGSELHAHEVLSRWAVHGLDISVRTVGSFSETHRTDGSGYTVTRAGGKRLGVPRIVGEGLMRRHNDCDAIVEIWNGIPFFTPLWSSKPRLVVLHHLHDKLWDAFFPVPFNRIGSMIERKVAPLAYRSSPVATLSESGRIDLIERTPLRAERIGVVEPGIDTRFNDSDRQGESPVPLIVAVGRLTSAKRFDLAIELVHRLSAEVENLHLVIVGEGPERRVLSELIRSLDLEDRVILAGRVSDEELVGWYHRAWLVLSASTSEGWGMTLTEAAACGTPAVASDIVGHRDSVDVEGGVLAASDTEFESAIRKLITDEDYRLELGVGAQAASQRFNWDYTASRLLQMLVSSKLADS